MVWVWGGLGVAREREERKREKVHAIEGMNGTQTEAKTDELTKHKHQGTNVQTN
jgi:hypothetical protein